MVVLRLVIVVHAFVHLVFAFFVFCFELRLLLKAAYNCPSTFTLRCSSRSGVKEFSLFRDAFVILSVRLIRRLTLIFRSQPALQRCVVTIVHVVFALADIIVDLNREAGRR